MLKKVNLKLLILIIIVTTLSFFLSVNVLSMQNPEDIDIEDLTIILNEIYNKRSDCLVTYDLATLKTLFDTSHRSGKYSLDHEIKRAMYMKDWSKDRGIITE